MFTEFHHRLIQLDDEGEAYTVSLGTVTGKVYLKVDVVKHSSTFIEIRKDDSPNRLVEGSHIVWTQIQEL